MADTFPSDASALRVLASWHLVAGVLAALAGSVLVAGAVAWRRTPVVAAIGLSIYGLSLVATSLGPIAAPAPWGGGTLHAWWLAAGALLAVAAPLVALRRPILRHVGAAVGMAAGVAFLVAAVVFAQRADVSAWGLAYWTLTAIVWSALALFALLPRSGWAGAAAMALVAVWGTAGAVSIFLGEGIGHYLKSGGAETVFGVGILGTAIAHLLVALAGLAAATAIGADLGSLRRTAVA